MLLWIRSAVLIYALFFGVRPFPGISHITAFLLADPVGWIILGVGTAVGGLFASFAFAISVFAIPMLLDRKVVALPAMGTSMALRSEERRVGKECVSPCRFRWSP